MTESQPPGREEAKASLNEADASRRAVVKATGRPVWVDLGIAVVAGAGFAMGLSGLWLAAFLVLGIGTAAILVVQRRFIRRRGRVLDERSVGARAWRFALGYLAFFLFTMFDPPAGWQPWFAIAAGGVVTAAGFAFLRWDARYQDRRLADGDYERHDLL